MRKRIETSSEKYGRKSDSKSSSGTSDSKSTGGEKSQTKAKEGALKFSAEALYPLRYVRASCS
ncbi:hypothetical protein [Acidovorax sp. A1169]|uniref:hypothetical protein n=1 Tax=Acidovorax sp. A1169 TaxID=3059524 RepID=UPI002737C0BA|nr:hypothetical protein [Acidovorax sp. A1169]MDP4078544.1 hypothetical protein [Acidovorax sp. A1169]